MSLFRGKQFRQAVVGNPLGLDTIGASLDRREKPPRNIQADCGFRIQATAMNLRGLDRMAFSKWRVIATP